MICIDDHRGERFVRGDLPPDDARSVESHLSTCDPCRTRVEEVRRNLEALETLRHHGADADDAGDADDAAPTCARFEIVREIGRGGMSVVYEARQERPPRPVALKVLATARARDPRCDALFEVEARALARLDHPAIATVYDAGYTDDGRPFIAMELVDGRPLGTYADEEALGRHERVELFAMVCEAVAHAHARGIVHRDLKPSNVLVDRDGRPRVVDFGLAHREAADVTAGRVAGTVPYMSSEQALGATTGADPPGDVHALGVMLFELLTGRLPIDIEGLFLDEALRAVAAGIPAGVSLPGDLGAVFAKATARDPFARYGIAADLAADVRRYLGGHPVEARPTGAARRLAMFVNRHRVASVAVVTAGLLILSALTAALLQARAATAAREAAERRLADALGHAEVLIADVVPHLYRSAGGIEPSYEVVAEVVTFYERIASVHGADRTVRLGHARALRVFASMVRWRGEPEKRRALMHRSHALVEAALADAPDDHELRFEHAYSYLFTPRGPGQSRSELVRRAATGFDDLVAREPENVTFISHSIHAHVELALGAGGPEAALEYLDGVARLVTRLDALAAHTRDAEQARIALARTRAGAHEKRGAWAEAEAEYRRAMDTVDALLARHPGDTALRVQRADVALPLARVLALRDRPDEAMEMLVAVVATYERLERADRPRASNARRHQEALALLAEVRGTLDRGD